MKLLKKILNGNVLLKIISFNSVEILVKILSGFIIQKALAIFVGPQGLGVVGSFRDFITSVQSISSFGVSNGIVKYVAEFKNDKEKLSEILSTAIGLTLMVASVCSVIIFFTASYWNHLIFQEVYDFSKIIEAVALAIPFYALNILLLAIINGYSKYKLYIFANLATSLVLLPTTLFLLWKYKLNGAIYSLILAPIISLLVTLVLILKMRLRARLIKVSKINLATFKKFSTYVLMALLSSIMLPIVRIAIRDYIGEIDGKEYVGYWEAVNRLSNFYLMFITSLMTLYVLPKLSEISTDREFRNEISKFFKTVLPLFSVGLISIYVFRIQIVKIFLTEKFLLMEPLFFWQLSGDFLKIAATVIAYQFLAKNMFWHYVLVEIFSVASIYLISIVFITRYGYVGASIGYLFNSFIYFITVLLIFRRKLFGNLTD